VDRAGVVECNRGLLTAPRLAPAHVRQSSSEVETVNSVSPYLFFRRLVFFATFFAAAFALLFFAMLPS
jgi:hypothetical protein